MKIIVIMHIESEGPGSLGTYLESVGAETLTVRLYAGDRLPAEFSGFDAVVSMGGPMNVYEEDRYPFLKEETGFLKQAVEADVPVLGICLGAQMIAKAVGAQVVKSPQKEVGWGSVALTDRGKHDTLFSGLPPVLEVLQWHGDMFHTPSEGLLLASSQDCPHQAFRYRNALGLQFHLEVTEQILSDWFGESQEIKLYDVMNRFREIRKDLEQNAQSVYANFMDLIRTVSGRKT
ncbi:MAG: type 1 glutamine amidotransferase [Desulfomonilaceae bacterium]